MRAVTRVAVAALAVGLCRAPLAAQERWVPPQPPCDLTLPKSKLAEAVSRLMSPAEKSGQRDQQLAQAHQLLIDAIVRENLDKAPAPWYYLGRYYVELGDAVGADTAFARALALEPKCAQDIGGYRHELWVKAMNDGLAAWQDGREDSAVVLLHLAARLEPANPKPLATLGGLYATKNADDSALAYYRRAADVAGRDTAFAADKRDALSNAWRLLVRRVQAHPAAQETPRLRTRLDSTERALARDSAVLAKLVASARSRRARGAELAPADQRRFAQDSMARAQSVAQAQAAHAATLRQLAADSSALATAFAPAIEALRAYLAAYPDGMDAAMSLATLYAQSGRPGDAAATFDSVAAHARGADPSDLFTTGDRLVGQGYYRAGVRALALGLERNPFRREPLYSLAVAYYQLRDSANLLPVAQRLVALDPLNRATLKLAAAGWDFRGRRDSTLAYLTRADSGLAVEIAISVFTHDSVGASLGALAANLKSVPSKAFRLTVEFLDTRGQVVAAVTQDVAPLAPHQGRDMEFKASGVGIAGWRYRAS